MGTDIISAFINMLFDLISGIVSLILSPIDAVINIVAPQAGTAVVNFFTWATTAISNAINFIDWFFYLLGFTPLTMSIMLVSIKVLLIIFLMVTPTKAIISVIRGVT